MTSDVRPGSANDSLRAFIDAATDQEADVWLAAVFGSETERILRQAIVRALGARHAQSGAVDDVVGEARLRLLSRVRDLRARRERDAIADFGGYTATVAFNAAYVFLRTRHPARTRLKNKVRYVLTRHPRIRLGESAGEIVCEWNGPRPAIAAAERLFRDDVHRFADVCRLRVQGRALGAVVADIVSRLDRPIALDALVDGLAALVGIADEPAAPAPTMSDVEQVADPARTIMARLEDREYLARVWSAISHLQPRQRAALLLNLRDPGGGSALRLVPLTGLASIREIAQVIDIPADALTRLWGALPLDDLQIGAQLGITRQQVINLRKTARATLLRRLR